MPFKFRVFLREFYIAVKKLSILQIFVVNGLVTYLLGFEFKFGVLIYTIKSRVLMRAYNIEINFSQKDTVNKRSNFPFMENLIKTVCASKQDKLIITSLRYLV